MGKNKLKKFKEISEFENVLELTDFKDETTVKPAGRWNRDIFSSGQPIVLELACGKGEYTLAIAQKYPQKNVVGIDIKGNRIWKGAKQALTQQITNVRFLRIYIDHLDEYFAENEVSDIWITFPDPYKRYSKRHKRLTSPKFLDLYKKIAKPDSHIHLKTDSDVLFSYTQKVLKTLDCPLYRCIDDIYALGSPGSLFTTKTYYEKKHLEAGKTIKYIEFGLPRQSIDHPKKIG